MATGDKSQGTSAKAKPVQSPPHRTPLALRGIALFEAVTPRSTPHQSRLRGYSLASPPRFQLSIFSLPCDFILLVKFAVRVYPQSATVPVALVLFYFRNANSSSDPVSFPTENNAPELLILLADGAFITNTARRIVFRNQAAQKPPGWRAACNKRLAVDDERRVTGRE